MPTPLPLAHVRVVDFTWVIAGPQATRILADFGAETVRVEYHSNLDTIRNTGPFVEQAPGVNRSGFFNNMNRAKRSITLNVHHPDAFRLLKQLIALSDVVIENYSSRVMEDWGLGYEELRRIKPDIIYLSLSGFGHFGRHRDYITWGPTAQALSGLTAMSGLPGLPPAGWGYSYMDHTAGFYGAIAVLMALHHRNRTGQGQWIDMSQAQVGMALTGSAILDYVANGRPYKRPGNPPGNRLTDRPAAPHGAYPCRDGEWCAIAVFTDDQWRGLRHAMGEPAWTQEPRFASLSQRCAHQDELDELVGAWTRHQDATALMQRLQAAGVPAGRVQVSRMRAEEDPQLAHRGYLVETDHPEIGRWRVEAEPALLSATPSRIERAAPVLGEANGYVYQELLGLPDEDYARLVDEAAV